MTLASPTIDRLDTEQLELGYWPVSCMIRENHERSYIRLNCVRRHAHVAMAAHLTHHFYEMYDDVEVSA